MRIILVPPSIAVLLSVVTPTLALPTRASTAARLRWMLSHTLGPALGALGVLSASRALACPNCEVGRTARAAVFGDSFLMQLWLISLPLLLIVVVAALLQRIGMPPRKRGRS